VSGSSPEETYYLCAGGFLLAVEGYAEAAEAFNLALELDENSISALEGLVVAYASQRLCDVAVSFLLQLSDIADPSSEVIDLYDANCSVTATDVNVTPNGDLIGEEEAVERIETAVTQVEGVQNVFVFFDSIDFEISSLGVQRVLLVQFTTQYERDSAELNRQLSEVIFAAVEGFVLADSEPLVMFVQARTGLTDLPAGFIVTRLSSIFWYNGDFSTAQYRQTWSSFDEILENIEEEG
jgi:hypothetical protein